jgi:hypothetical protein
LGYRRRALVLAAMELTTQTLFHSFHCWSEGLLSISLVPDRRKSASLVIEDSGVGWRFDTQAGRQVDSRKTATRLVRVMCRHARGLWFLQPDRQP